ncbi:MAG: hypothetical protein AAGM67_19500, partial [Bacteroidota bacterium]
MSEEQEQKTNSVDVSISRSIKCPTFGGERDNWRHWKTQFKSFLMLKQLWQVAETGCTFEEYELQVDTPQRVRRTIWEEKQRLLYHYIVISCEGQAINEVEKAQFGNGSSCWMQLKAHYENSSSSRV